MIRRMVRFVASVFAWMALWLGGVRKPRIAKQPIVNTKRWTYGIEASGKAGEMKSVLLTPQRFFRSDRFVAVDDSGDSGKSTFVTSVFVSQKNQLPVGDCLIPTYAILPTATADFGEFDTAQPAMTIQVMVKFDKDCTWYGALHGKTVDDKKDDLPEVDSPAPRRRWFDRFKRKINPAVIDPGHGGFNWTIMSPECEGKAGEEKTVSIKWEGEGEFVAERFIVDDGLEGFGTKIAAVFIDGACQTSPNNEILSAFYSQRALGNTVEWKAMRTASELSIRVKFIRDCKWVASVFGKNKRPVKPDA